jgi:hypothetical protein
VRFIQGVDQELAAQAGRAVNVSLTISNLLIGCYNAEYELRGQDRASYGDKLLDSLAAELSRLAVRNSNRRQLYRYLWFYRTYPGIMGALSPHLGRTFPVGFHLRVRKWGRRPRNPASHQRPSSTDCPTAIWN